MNNNQDLKTKEFTLRPDDAKAWEKATEYLTKHDDENLGLVITHLGKIRTLTQNASIHKYCSMLASALNDGGHYYEDTLFGIDVSLPWTMARVKEKIWHVVQQVQYPHAVNKEGEVSTSKLNTVEVGEVYKIISQNIAAERGIDVPWPSNRG
jgi:hypothetical protein